MGNKLPCIQVNPGEISPRVLTCGDPKRAELIAAKLEDAVCVSQNREFWSYNGLHKGVPVTVTSHGVGCGGAVIAFESLCRAGAKVIIRVGTCGGMQAGIDAGSIVIATGACREDGVTEKMIPLSYPAIAHRDVVYALEAAAREKGIDTHSGLVLTQALFYPGLLETTVSLYQRAGIIAGENEVSGLLVVGGLNGIKTGAILAVDAKVFELEGVESYQPDKAVLHKAIDDQSHIALDALIQISLD
ncbi:MAG: nucleoside phosphorylase [Oscillospiraceae bacterium]|nr:nucleoside phosphorylase [Oscillospiraceae bacterium]